MNMHWFFIVLLLCFSFNVLTQAAHHRKHLPSAVVVGTVYCDTCFHQHFSKNSHFIRGATVEVECKNGNSVPDFRREAKTDERGEFRVELPFSVAKHVKRIKGCLVKLINSSEPYCSVASTTASSSLHLKLKREGIHVFSAGFFTFKPQNQPSLCSQKLSIPGNINTGQEKDIFPPPLEDPIPPPMLPLLPPLPELPLISGLPIRPPIPPATTTTKHLDNSELDRKQVKDFLFPPIFPPIFQPPPSILPPNPLQPPPALIPPFLPPNPFQPPPSPWLPIPPIPWLTPPPPPPAFPFPLPPFPPLPHPPTPLIPGRPPASTSP